MSGYIVQEDEDIYRVHNNIESECYWVLYSDLQRRRFRKVLKQLKIQWGKVYDSMMLYKSFDIDIDPFMDKIYKIFFMTLNLNRPEFHIITQKNFNKKLKKYRQSIKSL